jgi:hypothetical protein
MRRDLRWAILLRDRGGDEYAKIIEAATDEYSKGLGKLLSDEAFRHHKDG